MFKRNRFHFLSRMMLLSFLVLVACQPIQPQPASSTTTEVMTDFETESAEADPADDQLDLEREMIAREVATFDHLRQHDVAAVEAEISADFSWIDATGVKTRADYLAVVADENLTFDEPVRGEMEVRILSPEVVLVIYAIDTHGSYDGAEFSNHEYISSLWVNAPGNGRMYFCTPRRGKWRSSRAPHGCS